MQSAPTIVSSSRVQWSTAPSCTDVRAPTTMPLWSPRSTACGHTVTPGPITTLPMIVASGCTKASGRPRRRFHRGHTGPWTRKVGLPGDGDSRRRRTPFTGAPHARLHDRRRRDRARARRRAPPGFLERLERFLRRSSRRRTPSRAITRSGSATLLSRSAASSSSCPCTGTCCRSSRACSIRVAGSLVVVVDRDPAGRDRAADPRRRPADPRSRPHPPTGCATRCGRSPTSPRPTARPGSSPDASCLTCSPSYGAEYDSIAAEMPAGSVPDLARQPVARRRREHDRRDAHGHRDELLRRLHPPAGEPAARPVTRDRLAILAPVARARRLQRLQHADRPHQQAVARAAPARSAKSPTPSPPEASQWCGTTSEACTCESTITTAYACSLQRPRPSNAFDTPLYDACAATLHEATARDDIACVVLTGTGRAFSAGRTWARWHGSTRRPRGASTVRGPEFPRFIDTVITFEKPLIAAVNGLGVGIGLTVLLHCDLVLIAHGARLRAPFVPLGVVPETQGACCCPQ